MAARFSCCRLFRQFLRISASPQRHTSQGFTNHIRGLVYLQSLHQNDVRHTTSRTGCAYSTAVPDQDLSDGLLGPEREIKQDDGIDLLKSLDSRDVRRLKRLQLDYEITEATGGVLPQMNDKRWLELLRECPSYAARAKRYHFWTKKDHIIAGKQRKKAARRLAHEENLSQKTGDEDKMNNRIMHRVIDSTMLQTHYNNLAFAMQFGDKLVFDLGFEKYMKKKENVNLVQQLLKAHHYNKIRREPFHWIIANCRKDHPLHHRNDVHFDQIPVTVTHKHYLDFLPKEKLVYLSPNSPNVLHHYNSDDIYIVGGIIDTGDKLPLTYAKAKREGIRSAKLPLDIHLRWGHGQKSLTLDQVMAIMLEFKDTHDWKKAFQFVPTRKLKNV